MPAENQMNGKLSYTSATGTCFIKHFDFRTNSDSLVLHSLSLRLWPLTSRIHSKTLFIPAISWKVHLKPFVRFSMPEALALQGRRAPVRPGDRQGDTARSPPNRTSSLLNLWSCSYSVCRTKQLQTMVLHPRLASSGKSKCPLLVWRSSWTTAPAGEGHCVFSTSAQSGSCWDWILGGKKHFIPFFPQIFHPWLYTGAVKWINLLKNRDKQYSFIIFSEKIVTALKQRKGCLILFCHCKKIYCKI